MKLWRISSFSDLKGRGGHIASARWHTQGRPIVYLAETPAGAMLERLVHLFEWAGKLPRTYTLLEIEADESIAIEQLLPLTETDWRNQTEATRAAGDKWLHAMGSPLARVPCAVVPRTWNYLLNPLHPDAAKVRIVSEIRESFDVRLFQSQPR